MDKYNMDYSLFNSIHNVFQEHGIIPKSVNEYNLFRDLNIKVKSDKDISSDGIENILKKIVIYNDIEKSDETIRKKLIDGINLYIIECGNSIDEYKLNVINGSNKKNAKSITLLKEKDLYKPIYITVNNKKQSLFKNNDSNLQTLFTN